jgi:ribonuclease D
VNLVRELTGAQLDKSSRFSDWSRRPLSKSQLEYALGDVTHLRGVYAKLVEELDRTGRATWVAEELEDLVDPKTYTTAPGDAWRRLRARVKNRKAMAVLVELASWRETVAQEKNVPRQRILKDEQLYDIANQAPATIDALGELRSLGQGFAKSARGQEIVAAVRAGLARDPKTVPLQNAQPPLTATQAALADLLRVLLKASAARHRVAARLIADSDDIDRLAIEKEPDIPALKGWRRDLFGADALRLKSGEVALSTERGEVVVKLVSR